MPDREPEASETSAAAPFLMLEWACGTVEVWASGVDRFTVRALGPEWVVVGFQEARQTAHALAERLE
jgi:hypothetical protein